jgi:hypothetical protein
VLSGGLGNLIRNLQASGHGETAESWVRPGPNQQIPPKDLAHALGGDTIDALSRQTGMNRDDLQEQLSHHLPNFVDQLTPQGRLPTEEEASRRFEEIPEAPALAFGLAAERAYEHRRLLVSGVVTQSQPAGTRPSLMGLPFVLD